MRTARPGTRTAFAVALLAGATALAGCGGVSFRRTAEPVGSTTSGAPAPSASSAPTTSDAPPATSSTSTPPSPTTTTASPKPPPTPSPKPSPEPSPKPKPAPKEGDTLHPGDSGAYVLSVQKRLSSLGYWLGTPDGTYGGLTSQAVMALQKAAGLGRDGIYGPATLRALQAGVRPHSRIGGTGVEVDKARQLLLFVRGGAVTTILNTSTGSGLPYKTEGGGTAIANTPAGSFSVFRTVNHLDKGPLGDLWRPRYFNGGIAVHGAGYVPGYPASHGCTRVSNPAMDMIWADNLMPVGSRVVVY
jgi:peptidoglycan hydrolase-like protein with peptidoglycan-binding domain